MRQLAAERALKPGWYYGDEFTSPENALSPTPHDPTHKVA
ncbi:hypothetical protein GCM10011428_07940 [Streptomyces violaceus]